jgi:branched-chain amino acid aminotransferase
MEKATGNYYYSGKNRLKTSDFSYEPGTGHIYEVIRILEGVPVFLEDHLERMHESLALVGQISIKSTEEVRNLISLLIKSNGTKNGNVKFVVGESLPDGILLYMIPHSYPDEAMYENGIATAVLKLERTNPNAKIVNTSYKEIVAEFIKDKRVYEALLVNREGCITEGSRSNVFFVASDTLMTPPLKDVLGGITRKKIIDIAKSAGIPFRETDIRLELINELQGAFMSGTSPKVLPISRIDKTEIPSAKCSIISRLMKLYNAEIEGYMKKNS